MPTPCRRWRKAGATPIRRSPSRFRWTAPRGHRGEATALTAYRIVQEALANALRHSGANRVEVVVKRSRGALHIVVRDNGAGLDATRRPSSTRSRVARHERTSWRARRRAHTCERRKGRRAADRVAADARGRSGASLSAIQSRASIGLRRSETPSCSPGIMKLKSCMVCLIHSTSVTSATRFPAREMLHSNPKVLEHRARIKSRKIRRDFVIDPDLVVFLERVLEPQERERRHNPPSSRVPLQTIATTFSGKFEQLLDHRHSPQL